MEFNAFQESKVELYQKLVASMLDGKLIWVNNVREGIEMVKRVPNMALLAAKESLELAAAVDCDVVVLSTGILPVWYALCLRKHSELTKFFSKL